MAIKCWMSPSVHCSQVFSVEVCAFNDPVTRWGSNDLHQLSLAVYLHPSPVRQPFVILFVHCRASNRPILQHISEATPGDFWSTSGPIATKMVRNSPFFARCHEWFTKPPGCCTAAGGVLPCTRNLVAPTIRSASVAHRTIIASFRADFRGCPAFVAGAGPTERQRRSGAPRARPCLPPSTQCTGLYFAWSALNASA